MRKYRQSIWHVVDAVIALLLPSFNRPNGYVEVDRCLNQEYTNTYCDQDTHVGLSPGLKGMGECRALTFVHHLLVSGSVLHHLT